MGVGFKQKWDLGVREVREWERRMPVSQRVSAFKISEAVVVVWKSNIVNSCTMVSVVFWFPSYCCRYMRLFPVEKTYFQLRPTANDRNSEPAVVKVGLGKVAAFLRHRLWARRCHCTKWLFWQKVWPRFPQQLCKPYGHRTATSGPPNSTLKTLLPYHRIKIWPNHSSRYYKS